MEKPGKGTIELLGYGTRIQGVLIYSDLKDSSDNDFTGDKDRFLLD